MDGRKVAGFILSLGVAQAIIAIIVAQSLYPNYSILRALSDLGVGSTAPIFNISLMILGLCFILTGYYIKNSIKDKFLPISFAIIGISIIGVGTFPETTGVYHSFFAFVALVYSPIIAILSSRSVSGAIRYFFILVGIFALVAVLLGLSGNNLGLGFGGIERLVVYPLLIWGLCFGGYLMAIED